MGGVHDHAALLLDRRVDALVKQSLQLRPWTLNRWVAPELVAQIVG